MKSTLGERLIDAMNGPPKVSGRELAKACGVAAPSVSGWRTGSSKSLEGSNLLAAAKRLGVRPEWLADGVGPKYHDKTTSTKPSELSQGVTDLRRKLTLAQLLEGLSDYLVEMDMDDRRSAVRQIAELADTPQRHAKIAASITAMAPPAAFQVEKRKKG